MTKYTIEFGNRYEKRIIGGAETIKECNKIIMKFLNDHKYKSHYQRMWVEENKVVIDVGSWSEFFWISRSNGSTITFEDIKNS